MILDPYLTDKLSDGLFKNSLARRRTARLSRDRGLAGATRTLIIVGLFHRGYSFDWRSHSAVQKMVIV